MAKAKVKETPKSNLVDITKVLELAEKYDEIQPYTLNNGEDMEFYPYFSTTKIEEILEEFQTYMQSEDKDDKAFMEVVTANDITTVLFWQFLAVKKFTHFGEQMKVTKASELSHYYNALLETGLLDEIINDVFLVSELKKINDMFATKSATMIAATEFLNTYDEKLVKARAKIKETVNGTSEGEE